MFAWLQAGCLNANTAMGVAEVQADLPCPLELWQASTEDEYRSRVSALSQTRESPRASPVSAPEQRLSVSRLVELLMSDEARWRSVVGGVQVEINRIALIITITGKLLMSSVPLSYSLILYYTACPKTDHTAAALGIHAVILSARHNHALSHIAPSIRLAITRWQHLWDHIDTPQTKPQSPVSSSAVEERARPEREERRGLHKHAVGLAWLAARFVDPRVWHVARFTRLKYFQSVGRASMVDLHEFMEACKSLQGSVKH